MSATHYSTSAHSCFLDAGFGFGVGIWLISECNLMSRLVNAGIHAQSYNVVAFSKVKSAVIQNSDT